MDSKDEDTIIEMCDEDVEGVLNALRRVLEEHAPPLLQRITLALRSKGITYNVDEMAEDIMQQVAMELLHSARNGKLMDVASLEGYVYRAAALRVRWYLRDEARGPGKMTLVGTFWENTDKSLLTMGVDPVEVAEFEKALAECIDGLEGKKREYIQMMADDFDNPPTPKEIAALRRVSPGSVRNRLYEARNDLEKCLKSKGQRLPLRRKGGQA